MIDRKIEKWNENQRIEEAKFLDRLVGESKEQVEAPVQESSEKEAIMATLQAEQASEVKDKFIQIPSNLTLQEQLKYLLQLQNQDGAEVSNTL